MDTPTYNAEGMQIYKPQPGENWRHGLKFRESYGGIIAEINDIRVEKGYAVTKTYPQNFAGIIAALNDLADVIGDQNLPNVGEYPPGWEIIKDENNIIIGGGWIEKPADGTLWFDTRQGRLFIADDGDFWQTNGGDGLTHVSDSVPTNPPVIGTTWFDTVNEVLYVYVGTDADGNGLWQVVKGAGELTQTTATLPLAIGRSTFEIYTPTIIPAPDPTLMRVQKDFNEYTFASLVALDKSLSESTVTISDTPPTENVVNGTLWYDSSTLELSVWYEDDDAGQWVPTAVSYTYDDDLAIIRSSVVAETTAREYAIAQLLTEIEGLRQGGIPDVDALETKVAALEDHVNNHPVEVDLSGYTTNTVLATNISQLIDQINAVQSQIPELTPYATKAEVNEVEAVVATLPTQDYVNTAISNAAPNLSPFVTQYDIDTSINSITTEYLPRTGGTLTGAFVVEKTQADKPAFDFSKSKWYSSNTHKYQTNSEANNYVTFGTTQKPWEYAWDFSSEEDFCWVFNDSNKVFSITKDGPACSQLYIGDFGENTEQGREVRNKIDVKDRLIKYQLAFTEMRQGVASATDFDELKANILSALAIV
jgi:hypothetical protein